MKIGRIALVLVAAAGSATALAQEVTARLVGQAAFGDWTKSSPGVERLIRPADLPAPFATSSATNPSRIVPRPPNADLHVPAGFTVTALVRGLNMPRQMQRAPNGDIFLVESGARRVDVLRLSNGSAVVSTFAEGMADRPYGIAFYPPGPDPHYVYIGTDGQVLRYPYHNDDTKASGGPEIIVPNVPAGHHWTRDVIFTPDGKRLLLAVGSGTNVAENGIAAEKNRADILDFDQQGKDMHIYASGIRNPVTMAFYPGTDQLWTTAQERDALGDDVPPDYLTRVKPGGFYGWPWYYIGSNEDPRRKGERPDLRGKVEVPDVLFQAHSSALGLTFYTGQQFPAAYRGSAFVALRGSWNRALRTGYKLVRIPIENGKPTGAYEDFLTGFISGDGAVWGRPVGLVMTADGSLLLSDDGSGTVWRIAYEGTRHASR
jgi:glucose/arabinose dehydrogenase